MRIPQNKLHWYAAFHDEGHHPHIHMMVWSEDPKEGYLARKGISAMRSKLTGTIFKEELQDLYVRKETVYRRSVETAQEKLRQLTEQLEQRTAPDSQIEHLMQELSAQLAQTGGKHQYGYLPKPTKALVDAIVDRLAVLPEVAACYEQWQCVKDELVRFHNQNPREHLPLSQQKEFRVIQNMVIREADRTRETRRDIVLPLPEKEAAATEGPVLSSPPQPTTDLEQPQNVTPVQDSAALPDTLRLLHHMSRIFQHDAQISPVTMRIDSKRRKKLMQKRLAMGHKQDDHEQNYGQTLQ